MAGVIVIFDFDKTIIDNNSDNWVVNSLGATALFEKLLPTMPWNSLMTILRHHGLFDYFSEINTNPGFVDDEGKLRIQPYHDFFNSASHGCKNLCPPNMCKGLIIKRIQDSMISEGKKRIIYLGDGKGDYCPSLKLGEGDFMMPRKNYPVWELIISNPPLLKAEIHEWSDAKELEKVLLKLINIVLSAEKKTPDLPSMDWKFQSVSRFPHEAFLQVLRVPH
ncbi:Inorganic pyrophosphatase 2 [Acorus calamus]|uniref:Inorganic pyrophosphatase 2 n=1 Tax=Acorus calamus TaxID=4465 RepID=A0AAV9EKJ5_ACOCL|nr:Inorganic pyrophosphatase 2 [Acorus calamus]